MLVFIIAFILRRGLPVLGLEFLTANPVDMGKAGGIFSTVVGTVALSALAGEVSEKDRSFYEGKLAATRFFTTQVLPRLTAERVIVENTDNALMEVDEAAF